MAESEETQTGAARPSVRIGVETSRAVVVVVVVGGGGGGDDRFDLMQVQGTGTSASAQIFASSSNILHSRSV